MSERIDHATDGTELIGIAFAVVVLVVAFGSVLAMADEDEGPGR